MQGGRGRPLSLGIAWGLILDAIVTIDMPVGRIIGNRRRVVQIQDVVTRLLTLQNARSVSGIEMMIIIGRPLIAI